MLLNCYRLCLPLEVRQLKAEKIRWIIACFCILVTYPVGVRSLMEEKKHFERIVDWLKPLSIIVCGVWALYLYFDGERERNIIQTELLKSEQSRQDLLKEKLELERSRLNLENAKKSHDLTSSHTKDGLRLADSFHKIKTENGYYVRYTYGIENTGRRVREITCVAVKVYAGSPIGDPSVMAYKANRPREKGAVKWESICNSAYAIKSRWAENPEVGGIKSQKGGSLTGLIEQSQVRRMNEHLIVKGASHKWVCFEIDVGFDGGHESSDWVKITHVDYLEDGK